MLKFNSLPPSIPPPIRFSQFCHLTLFLYLAEGRLHHIGEGLRRISHSHRLAELVSQGSGGSLKRNDSGGNVERPSLNRIYSAPQMTNMVSLCVCVCV